MMYKNIFIFIFFIYVWTFISIYYPKWKIDLDIWNLNREKKSKNGTINDVDIWRYTERTKKKNFLIIL